MIATQELEKEHKAVKSALSLLDRIMEKLMAAPNPVDLDHLEELVDFFIVFADQCHHGKEESFLFPALEKNGVKKQDGPIGVLLSEHEKGRQYVGQLKSHLPGIRKADTRIITDSNIIVKSYIALMQQHIQKEETVLFPMADNRLTDDQQTDLAHNFDILEQEKIGQGKHEQFHEMLKKLSRLY